LANHRYSRLRPAGYRAPAFANAGCAGTKASPLAHAHTQTAQAIELTVESAPAGLWTVVQWQDALGGWHDVEGWRGTLDEGDKKTWWVDKADYAKGPFRWVVYQGQGGDLLGTSESFYLPSGHGQIVTVEVSLAP
jgi:hypothetical protein